MSKLVKDIQTNPKPMFYACVLEGLRKIALKCGYALAVHGTCASDLDLIAVRWSDNRSEERRVGKECRSRWSPYH